MNPRFQILEHPADVGIEAYGNSLEELFENAAYGLFSLISVPERIGMGQRLHRTLDSMDLENLLVRWLNELLYLYDGENFLTARTDVRSVSQTSLEGFILGETYDSEKHELKLDVKAVTYHQLQIENTSGRWKARFFVDV
jgi:SHS2 domain-containing protein